MSSSESGGQGGSTAKIPLDQAFQLVSDFFAQENAQRAQQPPGSSQGQFPFAMHVGPAISVGPGQINPAVADIGAPPKFTLPPGGWKEVRPHLESFMQQLLHRAQPSPALIPPGFHHHYTTDAHFRQEIDRSNGELDRQYHDEVKTAVFLEAVVEKYALRTEAMKHILRESEELADVFALDHQWMTQQRSTRGRDAKERLRNQISGIIFRNMLGKESEADRLLDEWNFEVRLRQLEGKLDRMFPHASLEERRFHGGAFEPLEFASYWKEEMLNKLRTEKMAAYQALWERTHPRYDPGQLRQHAWQLPSPWMGPGGPGLYGGGHGEPFGGPPPHGHGGGPPTPPSTSRPRRAGAGATRRRITGRRRR